MLRNISQYFAAFMETFGFHPESLIQKMSHIVPLFGIVSGRYRSDFRYLLLVFVMFSSNLSHFLHFEFLLCIKAI